MAWIEYDNNRLRVNNKEISQELDKNNESGCIMFAENLTDGSTSLRINYQVSRNERTSSLPQAIEIKPGLNKIEINVGKITKEFYFYKPREGGARYEVRITGKIVEGKDYKDHDLTRRLLLLMIDSDVPLPSNRLYYKVSGLPMSFSFKDIESSKKAYYALTCPDEGKVEFYIETPIIPNSAVCYPSRDNIEYGITVSYVSEGK